MLSCREIFLSTVMLFLVVALRIYSDFLSHAVWGNRVVPSSYSQTSCDETNLSSFQEMMLTRLEKQATNMNKLLRRMEIQEANVERLSALVQASSLCNNFAHCEQDRRIIYSEDTTGVAFDCNTRKVYWKGYGVGVKRTYPNGTLMKLPSDTAYLNGLVVDPITGNIYCEGQPPKSKVRMTPPRQRNIPNKQLALDKETCP